MKIKIALGDLRHKTIGRQSNFMPLGISYIASYILEHTISEDVEVRVYTNPDLILKDITQWKPNVIGLSNYCWNTELSKKIFNYAKNINPNIVCIAGGPEFSLEKEEAKEYLTNRADIDFYVYFEGEVAITKLIQKIQEGNTLNFLKSEPQKSIISIHPKTKNLVIGEMLPRLKNLDDIPSPYLNGIMDQWFNGRYAPSIETARGCPFSCGYCYAGQSYYDTMTTFSVKRIKEELNYIAHKMKENSNILLSICDSNFGMTKRDEEIAEYMKYVQDNFGWPNIFDVTTGKANYDRILRIASLLKNKMHISCSIQSLNPKTLEAIRRKNIPMDQYEKILNEIRKRDMRSVAELIIPMPEETKISFFKSIKKLINIGVKLVVPYTTMLLKGTYLASKECRNKYQMQTKFRLIPRQIGEYLGEKCFEIEEVCIATNTFSFQDYLECRGFALITSLLSSEQFDIIYLHLKELDINPYDYLLFLWELIKSGKTELSEVYYEYLKETKNELWDSKKALKEYYTNQENYNKLLKGELGDNLIRKYKAIVFLKHSISTINLLYHTIENLAEDTFITQEIRESLDAAKRWMIACRDLSKLLINISTKCNNIILNLDYDVYNWYVSTSRRIPLISYKKNISYRISLDVKKIKQILKEGKKLYGEDLFFRVGKLFISWSEKVFWCNCEPL